MKKKDIIVILGVIILISAFIVYGATMLKVSSIEKNNEDIQKIKLESGMKDLEIKKLKEQTNTTTESIVSEITVTTISGTVDENVLEYLNSYNIALQTYVELLQNVMKNNGIEYPEFMYQFLVEEDK